MTPVIRPLNIWAVTTPKNKIEWYSVANSRHNAIDGFLTGYAISDETWKKFYRKGFRVIRVSVNAVGTVPATENPLAGVTRGDYIGTPKWLKHVLDYRAMHPIKELPKTLKLLYGVYQTTGVDELNFLIFELFVAMCQHQERITWFEETMKNHRYDTMEIRRDIENLKNAVNTLSR